MKQQLLNRTNRIISFLLAALTIVGCIVMIASPAEAANVVDIKSGNYVLTSALSGKGNLLAADVKGGKTKAGTNIMVYTANFKANETFRIESRGNGYYSIIDSNSKLAMTAENANCGNVKVEKYNGSAGQLWRFESAGSGFYYIRNKQGWYLDVSGGKAKSGTNIQVYTKNKTAAQKWKLNGYVAKSGFLYVDGVKLSDYKCGATFPSSSYYCKVNGQTTYVAAKQCMGYARYVQYMLYGKCEISGSFVTVASSVKSASALKKAIQQAGVGAHIRTMGKHTHSLVVIAITADGFTIADANGTAGKHKVGYKTYTWSGFLSGWGNVDYIKQYYA